MKETPIFEEVFTQLIKLPGFWLKVLIGGLLSFIPIVNIFAFGYLYRMSLSVRQSGQPVLPEWKDCPGLFTDGVKFSVVWLVYWLLPILLVILFGWLMTFVGLDALTNLVMWVVFLFSTVLFSSALYRYNRRKNFKDLFDMLLILRMTWKELPRMIVPALVFLGIFVLSLPFYGFALFAGFLLLLTYTNIRYRSIEQTKVAQS